MTSMEIAVTDASSGLTRLLVAISDWDGLDERGSKLAYLDYITCETLFFVANEQTYHAGLHSLAIYTDDMNSVKDYETLYQVGKLQAEDKDEDEDDEDSSAIVVTKIEQEVVETFSFDLPSLDYATYATDFLGKSTLSVIETNRLLWTHPLGAVLIDLDLRVARSVYAASDENLVALSTTTDSSRYMRTVSWKWSDSEDVNDVIWLHEFDMTSLRQTQDTPYINYTRSFALGVEV